MHLNELRKDYLLDRWVVIATQRKRRPTDFVRSKVSSRKKRAICPFCPGNENMTPPAILVYVKKNGKIIKDKDSNGLRHSRWLVRCIPNLYPAFTWFPEEKMEIKRKDIAKFKSLPAIGHHEVIIESPNHYEHPSVANVNQLKLVIEAYIDRFKDLSSKKYVTYVSIFRNHGSEAGASLSHAHTQIITTPIMPRIVREELEKAKAYHNKTGKCIFCNIIEKEEKCNRLIWKNENFIVFAPWASTHPFEFWIFPKRHQPTILDMNKKEIRDLAITVRKCLGGLKNLLNDPPYNFGFHMVPDVSFHWHIEVYPKLSIWAGFEKSTGVFINIFSPEEAASSLREALKKEN